MKTTATALLFAGAAALNPLKARRSVAKYSDKAVPASATTKALEAAIQAPNHFLSEPWRFYTAGPETKAKLCGLNEEKRKAAEGVPEWLVVTCASEHALDEKLGRAGVPLFFLFADGHARDAQASRTTRRSRVRRRTSCSLSPPTASDPNG